MNESERIQIAMDLVLADFDFEEDFQPYLGLTEDDAACHRVIREDEDGYGVFKHRYGNAGRRDFRCVEVLDNLSTKCKSLHLS